MIDTIDRILLYMYFAIGCVLGALTGTLLAHAIASIIKAVQ